MKHWLILLASLLIISSFSAAAQTIELNAVEDEKQSSEKTVALSEFIVSGCLDSLFESGYIGTNKRPLAGTRARFDAITPDLDTFESFIDFQLLIFLEYSAGEVMLPPDIYFKLVRVDDLRILGEGSLKRLMPVSQSAVDIEKACTEMGKALVLASLPWFKE